MPILNPLKSATSGISDLCRHFIASLTGSGPFMEASSIHLLPILKAPQVLYQRYDDQLEYILLHGLVFQIGILVTVPKQTPLGNLGIFRPTALHHSRKLKPVDMNLKSDRLCHLPQ